MNELQLIESRDVASTKATSTSIWNYLSTQVPWKSWKCKNSRKRL